MIIDRIKEIREDRDLNQRTLANVLNVTQAQYSRYELGINVIPIEKVCILADFYNTSVDYLLGRTDEAKPYRRSALVREKIFVDAK